MHNLMVTGHLGRDPEMRYTNDGTPVTTFTVADNGSKGGPVWFRVTTWRRLAEVCAEYLAKGQAVALVGQLRAEDGNPRVWIDQEGSPRASFELTAQAVEFLGGEQKEPEAAGDWIPF